MLSLNVAVTLAHLFQALIKGPADLRCIADSFDFRPGGSAALENHPVDFYRSEVGEHLAEVRYVLVRVDGDVAAVGLAGNGMSFFDHGSNPRYIEMLLHQFEQVFELDHWRLEDHVLDERDEPGFLDFLIKERHYVRISLADDVVIDVMQPVNLVFWNIIVDRAVDPAVLRHVGHGFSIKILCPELHLGGTGPGWRSKPVQPTGSIHWERSGS